jgi:hypothetical protein
MNTFLSQFPYILDNITLYTPTIIGIVLWLIFSILSIVIMRYVFLYSYAGSVLVHEQRKIESKKKVLGDLILMKDIQSELEAEIEKWMLKSTFQ